MGEIAPVILPVFLLIFLGSLLKRAAFLSEGFWDGAERITYYLLFPALLAATLAEADFAGLAVDGMAAAIVLALVAMALILLALRPLLGASGPAFTSVAQGSLRQNTYIGLALCFGLWGESGLTAAAVAVAVIVPLVNLLSVALLTVFGAGARPTARSPGATARQIGRVALTLARNPLVLACLLGLALNLSGLGLPPIVGPMLEILARGALPMGLLAVGAALDPAAALAAGRLVAIASVLKLALLPGLTALACRAFGVEGLAADVAILFSALPTAASSYILARQLGGDAGLMASTITLQTALALATLPLVLMLLG